MKRIMVPVMGAALIGGAVAGVGLTAFAAESGSSSSSSTQAPEMRGAMGMGGVVGTVTAVNGSTLTVTAKDGGVYTINASGATVEKYANGTSSTVAVSAVVVGDTIMVNGKIQTATMTASDIHDGVPPMPAKPVAFGKVTAISGSTITLSSNEKGTATTYTVNAGNATVTKITPSTTKGQKPVSTTITVSGIVVGDTLAVQGTANGSVITATSIVDGSGFKGIGRGMHGFGRGEKQD